MEIKTASEINLKFWKSVYSSQAILPYLLYDTTAWFYLNFC